MSSFGSFSVYYTLIVLPFDARLLSSQQVNNKYIQIKIDLNASKQILLEMEWDNIFFKQTQGF